MKLALILAASIAAFTPGPVSAASDIGCIESRLDAATMTRIGDRVIVAADAKSELDSSLDLDRDAVIAARNACRAANKWSNDAADKAMSWFKARATLLGAERAIAADGGSSQGATAAYTALPVDDRRSMTGGRKPSPAVIASITARANAAKPTAATRPRVQLHVGLLYFALAAIEFYPGEFATL